MDMDFEMGDAIDGALDVQIDELPRADDILKSGEPEEPGEVADDEHSRSKAGDNHEGEIVVPAKIYISGLNMLHTDDIRAYVKDHFGPVDKIEWIDDSSANLVFGNEYSAGEAITSLSAMEVADITALTLGESLPAKPFNGKPEVSLQVRLSLKSDKKQAGAALRSRYYLLHPEHDPEERRKTHHGNRKGYRHREVNHRRSSTQLRSASGDDVQIFEASMYDDAPRQHVSHRKLSPDNSVKFGTSTNRGKELFTSRVSMRHRSASPRRENESDAHMDMLDRFSHQNKNIAKLIKSRIPAANSGKELFPIKGAEQGSRLDQLEESIGSARLRDEDLPKIVDLPQTKSNTGFNIKGAAVQGESEAGGFAIRGTALANARELFPDKLGTTTAVQEALDSGRSYRRQKAQDLFL
ncbi:hypothetical protein E4U42_001008 [Claviceps africana]|uniref:Uncharacterized protein n=1 Tax=Claviceps africana TaxID=83212 RepID=A0A8K0J4S6_9HYPO|nr:hypothetical protein E4U42_001008 [Claviceps africana]